MRDIVIDMFPSNQITFCLVLFNAGNSTRKEQAREHSNFTTERKRIIERLAYY